MIRVAIALAVLGSSVMLAHQPTFSSRVEGVRVDVLVTDASRRPLRGLAAEDFVIRDNGVPQQVDIVSFGEISLNVGLAFDLSDSVAGERLEQLRAASRSLGMNLLSGDQSSLVTFDRVVSLRCPLSASWVCVDEALGNAKPTGETALIDGVFAGITVGDSEVGRSLLMVFSDGLDTASSLTASRVLDSSRRSDVVVYPIATKGARPEFLEDLAELTGGRLHELDRKDDLAEIFRAILDEFRQRYLVTYSPRGVGRTGWHRLEVRVNRAGARAKARPGYQGG